MTTSQTVYELGYLLVPTLTDKEVADAVALLGKTIADKGGSVTTQGDTHFIDLAYEMVKKIKSKNTKFDQAHFGWIKFTAGSETPAQLERACKEILEVLRILVVKTVEDDAVTDLYVSEDMTETDVVDVNQGVDMGKEEKAELAEKTKEAPAKEEKSTEPKSDKADDLTKVEGIGPKIAETLTAAGVSTFAELAKTDSEKIQEIIADVRGSHPSDTWPKQAEMAAEGKWEELKAWQDELDGGVE